MCKGIKFEEFCTYESILANFRKNPKNSNLNILSAISRMIERLDTTGLIALTHQLYKKWPRNTEKGTLITGTKRKIQANFYKEFYGKSPSESVMNLDRRAEEILQLSDKPEDISTIRHRESFKEIKKVTQKKPKVYKSDFSKKVAEMSLEDLIKWAQKANISQEKIDQHKKKPLGLAKMNISNMIRKKS